MLCSSKRHPHGAAPFFWPCFRQNARTLPFVCREGIPRLRSSQKKKNRLRHLNEDGVLRLQNPHTARGPWYFSQGTGTQQRRAVRHDQNRLASWLASVEGRRVCVHSPGNGNKIAALTNIFMGELRISLGLVDLSRLPSGTFFRGGHPGSEMSSQNDQTRKNDNENFQTTMANRDDS